MNIRALTLLSFAWIGCGSSGTPGPGGSADFAVSSTDGGSDLSMTTHTDGAGGDQALIVPPALFWGTQTSGTNESLYAIVSVGSGELYAVGGDSTGAIVHTADAATWVDQSSKIPGGHGLRGVWATTNLACAVGGEGTVLYSQDHGVNWAIGTTPTTNELLIAVWGSSSTDIYAVTESGSIFHSQNGCKDWQAQMAPASATLYGLAGGNGTVYAVGDTGVIFSTTGNGTWSVDTGTGTIALLGVWVNNQGTGFAVGEFGTLLRSNGTAWSPTLSSTDIELLAVAGDNAGRVVAVGSGGTLVHSEDSGKTWQSDPDLGNGNVGLSAITGGRDGFFVVGGAGTIYHSP